MKHLTRVVWSEGMYLGPHHFQSQSRYFEDSIRFATEALWFASYGFVGYELDAEALQNGTIALVHARGVFQDGLPFHMPECDALPEARPIAEVFPPARDYVEVSLAIPPLRPDGLNCVPLGEADSTTATRYFAETCQLHDETTGRDEKPVSLGRKNVRLALDIEDNGEDLLLPLARVRRDSAGKFVYDPRFVPPCVRISASEQLMRILGRLIDILEEKSIALGRGKRAGGKSWAEYSTRDIANFWMLHTVNAALAPLRHFYLTTRPHPESLYYELARLAGALCTFAIDSHPRSVPLYDHARLDQTFEALDQHIRTHLETIVPTNCVEIPLTPVRDYFWEGDITDQRVLDRSRWVLSVHSPRLGEADVIQMTPRLIKLCSAEWTPKLVERALFGLPLTHLPVPPSAISTRADTQYFNVSKAEPCWGHMVKTRRIGLYVPGEIPEPTVELLVVLES